MSNLNKEEFKEYKKIIDKYRNIFKDIYNKYPIVFEHGTPILENAMTASSVIHAHTHIVNHKYLNEEKIINDLNFKKTENLFKIKNKNYIFYINNLDEYYITYNFKSISQIMRKLVAHDLNIGDKYKWQNEHFSENIKLTIEKFKKQN